MQIKCKFYNEISVEFSENPAFCPKYKQKLPLSQPVLEGVISTFLNAIVLQTDNPTECINSPTFSFYSPDRLF